MKRIYKTARELKLVLREPERMFINPKVLDDLAAEIHRRAEAARAAERGAAAIANERPDTKGSAE
jgi:energy-coupling factor transporter ATP-binding protein EcfA2